MMGKDQGGKNRHFVPLKTAPGSVIGIRKSVK